MISFSGFHCDSSNKKISVSHSAQLAGHSWLDCSVMIACDGCADWFHPACVGMTIKQAAALDSYVCGQCKL
ncbi:hypothetical protein EMIHUDRAFT_227673 [Emiliania huxleyi CCMP1516]|uniref:Zinc finger PHD-type domain-containing protein n=2 Tax=Emiliania huxleyi TaxID=2903 RepID=A0A0D3KHC2_EMIH1|nr:hypothetical protein EMIHUDRAFT_227673 [Emiliania huxleyi CCMP1516]EOD35157.1 hypothetical protein EMIHUDRAFT_227673 [Emiliania huxleyi CCMP1516]|eukprot:XP_005787586.1 hypothetical protein EMIHUDRAFT_227673 [Emiliania huxleyi CCMP1516]